MLVSKGNQNSNACLSNSKLCSFHLTHCFLSPARQSPNMSGLPALTVQWTTHCELVGRTTRVASECAEAQRRAQGVGNTELVIPPPCDDQGMGQISSWVFPALRLVRLCLKDARCLENWYPKRGPGTSSIGTPGSV